MALNSVFKNRFPVDALDQISDTLLNSRTLFLIFISIFSYLLYSFFFGGSNDRSRANMDQRLFSEWWRFSGGVQLRLAVVGRVPGCASDVAGLTVGLTAVGLAAVA